MSILIIILLIILILGLNFLFFYFLYKKFGKIIINLYKKMETIPKYTEIPKKLTHFQQELDRVNKILGKYHKK